MSGGGKVYCVTGASGYIASWLVKLLLHHGHTVHATVRDLNDPKKTQHLYALEGAKERLHLFKADLLEDGSFDAAVHGCEGVFHTASPVAEPAEDPQADLIDPAVKGTLNVLGSCAKNSSVRRVVVTSSMATVSSNKKARGPDVIIDETWFSDIEYCKETGAWYFVSKIMAEEAAWKFSKENNLDMVVINPSGVFGPVLQPNLTSSPTLILSMIKGAPTPAFLNKPFGIIDVRDTAEAHILAMEVPSANGRYCLAERVLHPSELVKILKKLYPEYQCPEKCADEEPFEPTHQISKEKVQCLGLTYTPVELTLKDMIESFKEQELIN